MSATASSVFCGKCRKPLNEMKDLPADTRSPCPSCGSTIRLFSETITATVPATSQINFKHKDRGNKLLAEGKSGDSFSTKLVKWMRLSRLLDHKNDMYEETVTDPHSGEIVHQCKERLSEHRGHGDDKKGRFSRNSPKP